uniref:Integrase, catalytic region, zinc finger, CCHC-type, peptidase aspartic, catalytic n=1 Tax=Tanacetum cinerariifolium TaxID=118510 RepID=A0A699HPN4_TANCI|nr:hypothetical protein [Tanacetum cinerariifolium]
MFLNVEQLEKQLEKEDFQEIGSMATFKVLETQFQMFITNRDYLNDEYVTITRSYFIQYTRQAILEFRDTLIQHLESIKKSIDERVQLKQNMIVGPIYDEEPMAEVQTTAEIDVVAIGQQHTEQPDFNNEGKREQDIDAIETLNIELEHKVAKLLKENETLKKNYKELFDSIKITRAKTIEPTASLTVTNDKFKAQLQEKGWKPAGKIFKTVGLRWVPTGKIFASSTTKVDSEPLIGLNANITNQYECEQTLDVSAGTLNLSGFKEFSSDVQAMTSDHNSSEFRLHDHINKQSSSKLLPEVVPSADKIATSRKVLELLFHHHSTMLRKPTINRDVYANVPSQHELDLLFGPLYDEFFNAGITPSTKIPSTSAPSTHTNVHAEENNNDQAEEGEQLQDDEFTNPLCASARDVAKSSSHNIGNSNVPTFNQP